MGLNSICRAVRATYRNHVVNVRCYDYQESLSSMRERAMRILRALLRAEKAGALPPQPEPLVRTYDGTEGDEEFAAAVAARRDTR